MPLHFLMTDNRGIFSKKEHEFVWENTPKIKGKINLKLVVKKILATKRIIIFKFKDNEGILYNCFSDYQNGKILAANQNHMWLVSENDLTQ